MKMGLDNAVIGYITEKIDQLLDMQADLDLEMSPSKKTDKAIEMNQVFDGMVVGLKYWGNDEKPETPEQRETRQKALKEFGFPEHL